MKMPQISQEELHKELKSFGLDPSEWSLKKIQKLGFLIQNKVDGSFALYGKIEAKNKKPQWASMELISL